MDRSWITIPNKLSVEYANGISEFISVAEKCVKTKGMVVCPCCLCVNKQLQNLNVIKLHLHTHGFLSTYKIWYYHGEEIDDIEDEVIFNSEYGDLRDEQDDLVEGLNNAINSKYFDIGLTGDFVRDTPSDVCDKYDALFEYLHKPLFDNCKISVLKAVVRLMNIKVLNKITDKAFEDILKFLKEILPEGNFCPENHYQTRKLLCDVGLGANHPWQKSKEYDGSSELRGPPRNFTSEDILKQLEGVPIRTTGKAPNNSSRKRKRGANEAISFLARYVSDIEIRFSKPEHNWDIPIPNYQMDIFKSSVRPLGAASIKLLGRWKNTMQCDHKNTLQERGLSESEIDIKQREEFPSWFRKKVSEMEVQKSAKINDDLYSLSQGPLERYSSYQSCIVNGVRFRCKEYDDTLRTQCSGICAEGDHNFDDVVYYGIMIEILQLSFLFDRHVFLFRCKWYNSNPKGRSIFIDNNLTSINTSIDWYSNEPFILATQAQQSFYLLDMKRGSNWRFVQKVNHRYVYDIPEISTVVSDQPENDIF
ncbi:hypothetical protein POM88_041582 [Heracleum sosnowskyi]|uniref:Transposase n=1 Tax=Heracleum sosnowskyi TaxID=360622 RepID=A0AAD8HF87_9APIA|nr:hypothetical protein POM88_041582 [Heracleum sosnowskyi]